MYDYKVVLSSYKADFENKINQLAEEGYCISKFSYHENEYAAVMELYIDRDADSDG